MTISPALRIELLAILSETRHNPNNETKVEDSVRLQIIAGAFKRDGYRKYTDQQLTQFDKGV